MRSVDVKIFIGPAEIGKIAGTLGCAFRDRGIKVAVVRSNVNPFQAGMKYDQKIHLHSGQGKLYKWYSFIASMFSLSSTVC